MASSFREIIDPNWSENLPRNVQDFVFKNNESFDESLTIVDRILEPSTMFRFLEFALDGKLPSGGTTSLPLLPGELIESHLMAPYETWAPGPHDVFGGSPFHQILVRIGSDKDPSRLVPVEKGVHAMKGRLWEGVLPVSEERWEQKQLDRPENHHLACRYLGQVIEVFDYLEHPRILPLRGSTYMLIYQHFYDFDKVVNNLPERLHQPKIGLSALWNEYMTSHYTAMAARAHSWVISKTIALRERDENLLTEPTITRESLAIANMIHDLAELAFCADSRIFITMPRMTCPVGRVLPGLSQRREQMSRALRLRTREIMMQETVHHFHVGREAGSMQQPGLAETSQVQREAQQEVRLQWRGEPLDLPPQPWIRKLKEQLDAADEKEKSWGFSIYKLTYQASDGDWARFQQKLNADLQDWGRGLKGASDVKAMAKLTWYDGQKLGLREDNIEDAMRHFRTVPPFGKGTWDKHVFLVVDAASYDSYMYGSPFSQMLLPGDTGGFVTAVECDFNPNEQRDRAEESPLWAGRLRILGNLVYPELFALLFAQMQDLEHMWPFAMNHPDLIYTGFTVKAQVDRWKKVTLLKLKLFELFSSHCKDTS
ncbi:uncharacterized protein EI97DRAFT_402041 [Westerdykella ornata]|uniref:Uncharacterized protein n=1 Tax=Westerdykella ornata TaxID=318751 RepID=A0A6A6JD77_WESOR|nr:uncharacterized protein EI97DRAFT_402041 [Westerdykella ornata]KAF2274511.1 hypothetical protein EI97DRAFT_402041 [Westerdykella ornata]